MLTVHINREPNTFSVVLKDTKYDAINFYLPKLLNRLNNQVSGCNVFKIDMSATNGESKQKDKFYKALEIKDHYVAVVKVEPGEDSRDAVDRGCKQVLDEYHNDLRKAKIRMISILVDYIGEVDTMLASISHQLYEEAYPVERRSAQEFFDNIHSAAKTVTDHLAKFADDVHNFEENAANILGSYMTPDMDSLIRSASKDKLKAIDEAATVISNEDEEDDDDLIEGDLVTEGSNFGTREPLTDRDDDDYTDVGNDIDSINFEEEQHHDGVEEVPPIEESIDILGDEEGEV